MSALLHAERACRGRWRQRSTSRAADKSSFGAEPQREPCLCRGNPLREAPSQFCSQREAISTSKSAARLLRATALFAYARMRCLGEDHPRWEISRERRTVLIDKKRAALAAAALLGAASINPVHGSGIHGARSCKAAHVPASCNFRGASTQGPELLARWQYVGLPFWPYRRLVTPYDGVGVYYEDHLSCWTWVPADLGWQRIWECKWPIR